MSADLRRGLLVGHAFGYMAGRLFSGAVNLLALALYARALGAEGYGLYAVAMACAGTLNVAVFQWLALATARALPARAADPGGWLLTTAAVYGVLAMAVAGVGLPIVLWLDDPVLRSLGVAALGLVWAQAAFDVHLYVLSVQARPGRYVLAVVLRAALALFVGLTLIGQEASPFAPVTGWAVGGAFALLTTARAPWRGLAGARLEFRALAGAFRYAWPLALSGMLRQLVSLSDRLMLSAWAGVAVAGGYAAAADLTGFAITLLLNSVSLAGMPRALRLIDNGESAAAQQVFESMARVTLACACALIVGFAVLSASLAQAVLGEGLHAQAAPLMPWLAAVAVLTGIKTYYLDNAFVVGRASGTIVRITLAAAALNVALNAWWIPDHGAGGAVAASLVTLAIASIASARLGRRHWRLPSLWRHGRAVILPGALLAVTLWVVPMALGPAEGTGARAWFILAVTTLAGGVVYAAALWGTNAWGLRRSRPAPGPATGA